MEPTTKMAVGLATAILMPILAMYVGTPLIAPYTIREIERWGAALGNPVPFMVPSIVAGANALIGIVVFLFGATDWWKRKK